jgi:hypothetical protein
LKSFTLVGIFLTGSSFNQSQLVSGQNNTLSIGLSLNGNLGKGAQIAVNLPKDSFTISASNNPNITISNEDSNYYYILIPTTCKVSSGCPNFFQKFSLLVTNVYYVKKQANAVIISAEYDTYPSSQSYIVQSTNHVPMNLPNLTLTRNSSVGASFVHIEMQFNLTSSNMVNKPDFFNFGQISIDLSNSISSPKYPNTVYSFLQQNATSSQFQQVTGVTFIINNQNVTFIIPPLSSNASATSMISIIGKNLI